MTTRVLFSDSWYRVATLRPRLRMHTDVHRHLYRGRTWYVLRDRVAERFYRFSAGAYLVIGLMDGVRTVQEIWDETCTRLGDEAPTQDEVIHILAQLHAGDMLQSAVTPDADELFARAETRRRRRILARLPSGLSWRIPLVDPDRFLRRCAPVVRPLVGWLGATIWLAVVVPAAVLVVLHWRDLTHDVADRVLAWPTLVALLLLFPAVKALHELGHASLTKAYGGDVHDMGLMMLVFNPVPYVDASAAWAFPQKWRRIAVGAAGMLVELFIAALGVFLWVSAEPGWVRTIAFATIVNVGISTILFNANPLLRFDGYYMLADWLEIPNLWGRAHRYLGYLCERYAFGRSDAPPAPATPGERVWFVVYALAAWLYRAVVVVAIFMLLARYAFPLAVLFAVLIGVVWIAMPAGKGLAHVLTSPGLRRARGRAVAVTGLGVATAVYVFAFLPLPDRSRSEGVVWIPESAFVRAQAEGFVHQVTAAPGTTVRRGDVLLVLRDTETVVRVAELEARVRELVARYDERRASNLAEALVIREEVASVRTTLADARRRAADLTVVAGADGTFVLPAPSERATGAGCRCALDLEGRFLKQGELVGYVLALTTTTIRAIVQQGQIDLIRGGTTAVAVRLAERLRQPVPAIIQRIVPAAIEELPTTALGTDGGGVVPVDPQAGGGTRALNKVFQVDLELKTASSLVNVGGRAYVRFDHGRRSLAAQWYREIRQLFLSRFTV